MKAPSLLYTTYSTDHNHHQLHNFQLCCKSHKLKAAHTANIPLLQYKHSQVWTAISCLGTFLVIMLYPCYNPNWIQIHQTCLYH